MWAHLIHQIEDSRREVFEPIKIQKGNVDNSVVEWCVVPACLDIEDKGDDIQKIVQAKLSTKWVSHRGARHQVSPSNYPMI